MKAIMICTHTSELLKMKNEIPGVIHSVFQKVCNIEIQTGEIIPLIDHSIPKVPRCISFKLPSDQTMHSLGLKNGTSILINKDALRAVDRGPVLDLRDAILWDGKPKFPHKLLEEQYIFQNMDRLRRMVLEKGRLSGLGAVMFLADKELRALPYPEGLQINIYCEFIGARIMRLIQKILKGKEREIEDMAKQVIGFGLGLTPSADDLLSGMMVAMIYGANRYGMDLRETLRVNQSMIEEAAHRTTKISAEMLCCAAQGEVAENIRQLLIDIFSEKNEEQIHQDILSVIENGDTSGTDCIAGIYIGCILAQMKAREGGRNVWA